MDIFTDVHTAGLALTFICMNGHYILNIAPFARAYAINIGPKAVHYSARQLIGSRKASEFINRMGYMSLIKIPN